MRQILTIFLAIFILSSVAYAGSPGLIDVEKDKYTKDIEKAKEKLKPDSDVRVIITLKDKATDEKIDALKKRVGDFKVGKKGWDKAYPNGFGATIKAKQMNKLLKDSDVSRVDIEEQKKIALETANHWSGVTKARPAFSVTGDGNGNEYNYAPQDIVIAIVDTGIDPKHKDLTGLDNGGTAKIIGWYDTVNSITSPYDDHGHGTHVSSIAAGEGDSNTRYKGVAPGAALVGVKVCSSGGWCWDSDIIDGINWVVTNKVTYGIEIMSMSIGGYGSSDGTDPVSTAVNNAVDYGIVTTIAAGNSGPQKYTISSPGAAEKAITVAAMADPGYKIKVLETSSGTSSDDPTSPDPAKKIKGVVSLEDNGFYLAPWSSRGPTATNKMKPDISAPGVAITAAESKYPNSAGYHGGYVTWSGTSMATPFIAGVVALMLDAKPSLTPTQIKDVIKNTAEDYGVTGCDYDYGCGRVRAYRAISTAKTGSYTSGDQSVPTHKRTWISMGDNDWYKDYYTDITSDMYPFASTLIMYDWSGYRYGIDLDLLIYNPDGDYVGGSWGVDRQETMVILPETLGTYDAMVYRYAGSGRYALDRSYK